MIYDKTKLVLGRGELYFCPFDEFGVATGVGEIYIGNTPDFTTSREVTSLPRFDSYDGQRIPISGPIVRENHTARFTTDHLDVRNLAFWYGRQGPTPLMQARASDVTETFKVYRGRFYQLGASPANPGGARNIEEVKVLRGGVRLTRGTDFEFEEANARLQILASGSLVDGNDVTIIYERRDVELASIVSSRRELYGSLRFVSRNPIGPLKNYFYPKIKLTPTGDIDQKGSDWQRVSFEVEAQRLSPAYEYLYIDEVKRTGASVTEVGIIEFGGITIAAFPGWEDQLDTLVNVTIPSRNYK